MENEKKKFILKDNLWLLSVISVALAFLGLLFPMVSAKPITSFDPNTWEFVRESRTNLNAGIIFGLNGAVVWPTLIIYCSLFVALGLFILGGLFKKHILKSIAAVICALSAALLLISNFFYGYANALASVKQYGFTDNYDYYGYVEEYIQTTDSRLAPGPIFTTVFAAISTLIALSDSLNDNPMSIREMSEIGIFSALAIVLDIASHYLPNIPGQVGSLSFALLPLYFIALRHGPIKGLIAASFIYGLVTCFTDGYGLFLYPLDYMVGYSGVAIIGIFSKQIINPEIKGYNVKGEILIFISIALAGLVRLIGSGLSSIINYNYSLQAAILANSPYIFISCAMCAAILMGAYGPIVRLCNRFPVRR